MKTCTTKPSTPLKDDKQTLSMSTFERSHQRRKSIKVYSALKNQNKDKTQFPTPKDKIILHNSHLLLNQNKKEINRLSESSSVIGKQENEGIVIKLSLCGPKLCDINVQHPYTSCQQDKDVNESFSKQSRVIYTNKRLGRLDGSGKKSQSIKDKQEGTKLQTYELKTNFDKDSFQPYIRLIHTTKKPTSVNFDDTDYQTQKKLPEYGLKPNYQSQVQQLSLDHSFLRQISNVSLHNELKPIQKYEHTKNNSFSIRNFSTSGSPIDSSFQNIQHHSINNNRGNYDKLKQIYQNQNTFRSQISCQDNQLTQFYYENLEEDNVRKQAKSRNDLTVNVLAIDDKIPRSLTFSSSAFIDRSQTRQIDSSRTIIEMLSDWECKSDLPAKTTYQDERSSQIKANPQKNECPKMLKKFQLSPQ